MADFVQMMKDWRRMCEHCDRHENIRCVVNGSVCAGFRKIRDEIDLEVVEAKVTAWAAKHPIQYPTWWEWLFSIGAVTRKVKPDVASTLIETGLLDPIPADIAEKLGVKPKEGTC